MRLVRCLLGLATAALLLVSGMAARADDGPRRVALVIGNGTYSDVPKLTNAVSDAVAIGQALRDVGFTKVTVATDLTHQGIFAALRAFSLESAKADWAVIYYAGHGVEVDSRNYLVPVDAHLAVDRDVEFEGVSMQTVFAAVSGAHQLRLVILDACRDNPFLAKMARTIGTRAITRGLARVEPEGDLYVVYSASSGQVALDGDGGRNPFVAALLKNIETPGLEVNLLFRKVRADVERATDGQQRPDFVGSLPGDELYFKPRDVPPVLASPTPPLPSSPVPRVEAAPEPKAPPDSQPQPIVTGNLEPHATVATTALVDIKATAVAVQKELHRVGCDGGSADGTWTIQSRMALLNFSQHANVSLDVDKPDATALKALQLQRGMVCPVLQQAVPEAVPKRASLEPEAPPKHVAPRRPPPRVVERRPDRPPVARPAPAARPRTNCFMFNGQQVCE